MIDSCSFILKGGRGVLNIILKYEQMFSLHNLSIQALDFLETSRLLFFHNEK